MSITTGQQALIRRIVTMTTSANIVLPNGEGKDLPRYVIQAAGGAQQRAAIGNHVRADPEIVVRVETQAGEYAEENDDLVAALVLRFWTGDRFDGIKIIDAPQPRPPLPITDGVYSVPVVIRGRYYF